MTKRESRVGHPHDPSFLDTVHAFVQWAKKQLDNSEPSNADLPAEDAAPHQRGNDDFGT